MSSAITIAIIAGTLAALITAYPVAIWLERFQTPPSPGFGNDDCYLGKVAVGSNELLPGGHGGVKATDRLGTLNEQVVIAHSHKGAS